MRANMVRAIAYNVYVVCHRHTAFNYSIIYAAVGAYGIRPKLCGFTISQQLFTMRFKRWHLGRMQYAPTNLHHSFNQQFVQMLVYGTRHKYTAFAMLRQRFAEQF